MQPIHITDRTEIRAIMAYNQAHHQHTWAIRTEEGTACRLLEVEPGMMNEPNAIVQDASGAIEALPLRHLHLRGRV